MSERAKSILAGKRVALRTLGCKLNQYDTEAMREQLLARGCRCVDFDAPADIYIVNTCTVTSKADRDARRLLRQAKRRNPQAVVVAIGCYPQVQREALAALPEVDLILGNVEKQHVAHLLERFLAGELSRCVVADVAAQRAFSDACVGRFAEHTRAFLKIQEGCDSRCAYCTVPLARGPSRSRPLEEVAREVRRLVAAGHVEVVLIGIHLGLYGRDLRPPTELAAAVEAALSVPELKRLRLSSIEPTDFTPRLIQTIAQNQPRLCRHLHIPLQSGDDEVLREMGRPYTSAQYAALVEELARRVPEIAIGADVIVGFPGESEEAFSRTYQLIERLPLAYLHVFSYSPRPKTPAAQRGDSVRPDVKKRRSRALLELSQKKRQRFMRSLVGTVQQVLFERDRPGGAEGLTDNYVRVRVPGARGLQGRILPVRLVRAEEECCLGELC